MKLPNASKALVSSYKITDYLLSSSHPAGGSKAAFFMAFGFKTENWKELSGSLRSLVLTMDIQKAEVTPYGMRYTIDGKLMTPTGRRPWVRTIWFIETGQVVPRFITAYPLTRSEG